VKDVAEEIRPPGSKHKVQIVRRPDGHLQIVLLQWVDEDVPDHGRVASFWEEVHCGVSIAATLDEAREIARELLRNHA
jgi:hypothetical protein